MTKIANRFHPDHGRDRYYQDGKEADQLNTDGIVTDKDPDSEDQPDSHAGDL